MKIKCRRTTHHRFGSTLRVLFFDFVFTYLSTVLCLHLSAIGSSA
ncbi:unnamed protein product [Amoebophrya sp. A120]|nr:unnamed protein product [Amoebophrya sp. A120]|eukprot:GSA120T00016573001.1